jgi:hypothetical protein
MNVKLTQDHTPDGWAIDQTVITSTLDNSEKIAIERVLNANEYLMSSDANVWDYKTGFIKDTASDGIRPLFDEFNTGSFSSASNKLMEWLKNEKISTISFCCVMSHSSYKVYYSLMAY